MGFDYGFDYGGNQLYKDIITHLLTTTIMLVEYEQLLHSYRITPEPYYNEWQFRRNRFPAAIHLTKEDALKLLPRCSTRQARNALTKLILERS
jgi:hypothetical protein